MKTAFLFSGQGSQYPAMGKDLLDAYPEFSFIFEAGSDILGYDLSKIIFEASAETLSKTLYTQPSVMAVSLLCFKCAVKNGIEPDAAAGHSLGEFAAMTALEMLSIEDAFKVIKARAEAMDKAASHSDGAMAAVLKLPAEKIEEICSSISGYVVPVNYNSPLQTVIAGETSALDEAASALKSAGARVMPLKVSSAFHSKLMQPAADEFYDNIKSIRFSKPVQPFYSNVTGDILEDFSDMHRLLAKHIVSPVRFTNELNRMHNDSITAFAEAGPGAVLTGLVKKTLSDAKAFSIENTQTLNAAIAGLRADM